jgi:hypothetical protein
MPSAKLDFTTAAGVAALSADVGDSWALLLCFDRNFASTSFERARALAARAFLTALLGLFAAAVFLPAAFTGLFAALCPRTAVPTSELLRFRFASFGTSFFIFSRIALRAVRALEADLLFPTRFRALGDDASLGTRFDAAFALDADPIFFVFDFVVFFDLRAAIGQLSTRECSRTPWTPVRQHRSSKQQADSLSTK